MSDSDRVSSEEAICQGCGVVLKGSREPGEKDYCVEVGREVTLTKPNRNRNAQQLTPFNDTRSAIEAHRNGERVPLDIHPNDRGHGVVP